MCVLMGGAASVPTASEVEACPLEMNESETRDFAKKTLSGEYNVDVYASFVGPNGTVSRSAVVAVATERSEQELFSLFSSYTVDGILMDNSSFIELLRDVKILSKNDLTTHYANMIFKEQAAKLCRKRINYAIFRDLVVPLIASSKALTNEQIIRRFCLFEEKKTHPKVVNKQPSSEGVDKETREQHQAATKMQKLCRGISASKQIAFMRECSMARLNPTSQGLVKNNIIDPDNEGKLKEIFDRYAGSYSCAYDFLRIFQRAGELERKQFVRLCSDAKLIGVSNFSVDECNLVFDKAMAVALNEASESRYKSDVFFGKRFGFLVFKDIAISCIVEKTGLDTNSVLQHLYSISTKTLDTKKMNLDEVSTQRRAQ